MQHTVCVRNYLKIKLNRYTNYMHRRAIVLILVIEVAFLETHSIPDHSVGVRNSDWLIYVEKWREFLAAFIFKLNRVVPRRHRKKTISHFARDKPGPFDLNLDPKSSLRPFYKKVFLFKPGLFILMEKSTITQNNTVVSFDLKCIDIEIFNSDGF